MKTHITDSVIRTLKELNIPIEKDKYSEFISSLASSEIRSAEDWWFKGFEASQTAEELSINRVYDMAKSKDYIELIALVESEIIDGRLSEKGKAFIGKAIDGANIYTQIKQGK